MNTRLIVPAVLSAVMISAPVLAGTTTYDKMAPSGHPVAKTAMVTPAARCTILESQFDAAIKTHESAAKANWAKTMRTEGGRLCASGNQSRGIVKLRDAIEDIGVKARA